MRANAIKAGKVLGLSGLALVAFVNNAMAAVPAAVTSAITDAGADAVIVAGAILVVVVSLLGFRYMRKELH